MVVYCYVNVFNYLLNETMNKKIENTKILIYGDKLDFHMLKIAINAATTGNHVWFITPEAFRCLPAGLGFPDKEILKLIRFFYLKDCFGVLKHLNQIQSWMQLPFTLILHKMNDYVKDSYEIAVYLMCNLIDSMNHCARKCNFPCYLILGCDNVISVRNIFQKLIDLYIDHVVITDNIAEICNILKY